MRARELCIRTGRDDDVESVSAREVFDDSIRAHQEMVERLASLSDDLAFAAEMLAAVFGAGGQVLVCGNGGSAADAQHIAAEFTGRFLKERRPYPAIALSVNTSSLTAIANDYGFETVFARQVEAFGRPGDALMAISTSGESPNVLAAVRAARSAGMKVIALSGGSGGALADASDVALTVAADSTPRIQEGHILLGHILCEIVEDMLC